MANHAQSTSSPSVFNFQSHQVRVINRDGQPWFVATDVCAALGYSNPSKAVADHLDDDERSHEQLDRSRMGSKAVIINESGLYALVLRSHKPQARKFAKWVTSDVLPSIRKTGRYEDPSRAASEIDVRNLLLSGNSSPAVTLPPPAQKSIDERAFELAGEAFHLIKEHLQRRVAFNCEYGYPKRVLNVEHALDVIGDGTLGFALAHAYHTQLDSVEHYLEMARLKIEKSRDELIAHRSAK